MLLLMAVTELGASHVQKMVLVTRAVWTTQSRMMEQMWAQAEPLTQADVDAAVAARGSSSSSSRRP